MKPPFRRRTGLSRFLSKNTEEEPRVSARSFYKGWNRKDLQNFLQALKQQQNFESALDLTEIQKKVPQRSLKEIEDLIITLKSRVLQKVYLQVRSQRREGRKAEVPIELWAELVQKISRPYEKTISSAFSQMLVIAAIEPCGLMHSDPPHPIMQTPAFSSLHPVQSPETPSRLSSSESAVLLDKLMRHFLQLHSQLIKPAKMPASSSNSDRDVLQVNVADSTALPPTRRPTSGSTKEPFSESSVTEPAKDKKDWVTAGTCPLNPLLVPIALLKRPSLDSEK